MDTPSHIYITQHSGPGQHERYHAAHYDVELAVELAEKDVQAVFDENPNLLKMGYTTTTEKLNNDDWIVLKILHSNGRVMWLWNIHKAPIS